MRFVLLAAALQAAFSTATLTARTLDASTQIEKFLAKHDGEPGFGLDGNNVTKTEGTKFEGRSIQARGLGRAFLVNRCDYDVWLWSVDGKGSSGAIKVNRRSQYIEGLRTPCTNCGVSLKVSNTNQLEAGRHTQFEYAIKDNIVYYDISYVDCAQGQSASNCPGHAQGHRIDSPESRCGVLQCKGGAYCPWEAYYVPQPLITLGIPEPVKGCGNAGTGMDIKFIMCSDKGHLRKRGVAGRVEITE